MSFYTKMQKGIIHRAGGRDDLAVKNVCCGSRGPEFGSYLPQRVAHNSLLTPTTVEFDASGL